MVRKVRAYTAIGDRISTLGRRQREIAHVLGVSQQTVSKKLRGETAILLSDLEKLGEHYKVPLTYFFEETPGPPELVVAWERIRRSPGPIQDLVVLLDRLPPGDVQRILEIARVVGTSGPSEAASANPGPRPRRAGGSPTKRPPTAGSRAGRRAAVVAAPSTSGPPTIRSRCAALASVRRSVYARDRGRRPAAGARCRTSASSVRP